MLRDLRCLKSSIIIFRMDYAACPIVISPNNLLSIVVIVSCYGRLGESCFTALKLLTNSWELKLYMDYDFTFKKKRNLKSLISAKKGQI